MKTISILTVEDQLEHQLYLNTIVSSDTEFKNLGFVRLGSEAIKEVEHKKPNIVIIDIGLPDMSGIDCIRKLAPLHPDIKFMVCTVHEEDEKIFEALKAGAHGYILKKSKPYQIIDAIKEMHEGAMPISSSIASKILHHLSEIEDNKNKPHISPEYGITEREGDILNLLAKGHSYQEIADLLFISIKTLKWHVYNIYKKLHANNRTEAINKYFKN